MKGPVVLHTNSTKSLQSRTKPLSATQQRHRLNAATGYLMLGMAVPALRELDSLGETESLTAVELRADALRELGRFDDSLPLFEQVLAKEPASLNAAIGKAWCLKRLSRLEGAIDALRSSAIHHPREALIQYNLACYFALFSDKDRCLSHLGIALRLNSFFAELIDEEPDFDAIRSDEDFVNLVRTIARVA